MNSKCDNCSRRAGLSVKKMGLNIGKYDFTIALAGNPNTGKSTVFNALTGLRQHTGNWSGKTVVRAEGAFEFSDNKYKIIDLPGTYSLLSTSEDEEIARNFILFGKPSVTIIVADATRLERNMNLILQILEITESVVLCLNLMDEAKRNHIEVDVRTLSKRLGIPVVPVSARSGDGIRELLAVVNDVATKKIVCKPYRIKNIPDKIEKKISKLTKDIQEIYPALPNCRWLALRLMDGDSRIIDAIKNGDFSK